MRYRLKIATWTVVRDGGVPSPRELGTASAAAELVKDLVREHDDDKEHFWVLVVDQKHGLRSIVPVSIGTQTGTLVHPREVFGPALREGAVAIILAHNHPSGDPTPSREDIRLTRQLVEAGTLLDVKVHDHVIVGNGSLAWVSMAERGLL